MNIEHQMGFEDVNEEYRAFVDKFKPKKTTDDCYTPENIYNAVADWAAARYGFDKSRIVRPFWPGGDYERFDYPEGCVVLDNPPFSILSKIVKCYLACKIDFFLFAPALTLFSAARLGANVLPCGVSVTYANGAVVPTSFCTSMGEYLVECRSDLFDAVERENDKNERAAKKELPKYEFPDEVITAAKCQWFTKHHTPFAVRREECQFIRILDEMPDKGSGIFGGGFLLSERAAAERAAAERAAAERAAAERAAAERAAARRWKLSEREREIQKSLSVDFGADTNARPMQENKEKKQ